MLVHGVVDSLREITANLRSTTLAVLAAVSTTFLTRALLVVTALALLAATFSLPDKKKRKY